MPDLNSFKFQRADAGGSHRIVVTCPSGSTITYQWSKANWGAPVKVNAECEPELRRAVAESLGRDERSLSDEDVLRVLAERAK